MNPQDGNPDRSHVRSREAVEAMNKTEAINATNKRTMDTLKGRVIAGLGGEEHGARYEEFSSDHTMQQVPVERTKTGEIEYWNVFGIGENNEGNVAYIVGTLDSDGILLGKPVLKEQLDTWEKLEHERLDKSRGNLGNIALRLSGNEAQPVYVGEVVDAPVGQLDSQDNSAGRFDRLFNPDYDDNLSDNERVEAAAVRPEENQDSVDQKYRRIADDKYNQVMGATGDAEKAQAAADRVWESRPSA